MGKLRGVESFGMLCSSDELGLEFEGPDGLCELPSDAPLGVNLRDYLKLDDQLFTLKLTPNLAHCLSVYGVAQELSAITGAPLNQPVFTPIAASHDQRLAVHVVDRDLCGRFAGRVVRAINPQAKTPDWMVARLARCGQRAVDHGRSPHPERPAVCRPGLPARGPERRPDRLADGHPGVRPQEDHRPGQPLPVDTLPYTITKPDRCGENDETDPLLTHGSRAAHAPQFFLC